MSGSAGATDPNAGVHEVVRALARELGLADAAPELIADKSNMVLRVGPIVARVAMATSMVRVGMAWLRREVEVSRFLASHDVGVTRPIAGPFDRDGLVISFWETEKVHGSPEPRAAGAELKKAHLALARYEGELPLWGAIEEARLIRERGKAAMTDEERERFDRGWDRAERIVADAHARSAGFQAVHGDAHLNNVLATERGVLWTDWEDAFLGPVEYDVACLRSRADLLGEHVAEIDAMCAAYGEYDRDLVRDLALVRNVQVIAWTGIFAERDPSLLPRMRTRIAAIPRG